MKNQKEIKNKTELLKILKSIPIKNKNHRNSIVCSLIGHSLISTTYFGYRYCGRCEDQIGDSLGSIDCGIKEAVIIGHNCKECRANYKKCTWKDTLYVQDPFKKQK